MTDIDRLIIATTEYFSGDPRRIQHFMKVYTYASLMGRMEKLSDDEQLILEAAAVVHDTGIKKSEELFGYNNGKLQEQYGPEAAEKLLRFCGFGEGQIERICYLVGHHHTYDNMNGIDYHILVEADFIVNLYEDGASVENVKTAMERIFRTESGKRLLRTVFGLD